MSVSGGWDSWVSGRVRSRGQIWAETGIWLQEEPSTYSGGSVSSREYVGKDGRYSRAALDYGTFRDSAGVEADAGSIGKIFSEFLANNQREAMMSGYLPSAAVYRTAGNWRQVRADVLAKYGKGKSYLWVLKPEFYAEASLWHNVTLAKLWKSGALESSQMLNFIGVRCVGETLEFFPMKPGTMSYSACDLFMAFRSALFNGGSGRALIPELQQVVGTNSGFFSGESGDRGARVFEERLRSSRQYGPAACYMVLFDVADHAVVAKHADEGARVVDLIQYHGMINIAPLPASAGFSLTADREFHARLSRSAADIDWISVEQLVDAISYCKAGIESVGLRGLSFGHKFCLHVNATNRRCPDCRRSNAMPTVFHSDKFSEFVEPGERGYGSSNLFHAVKAIRTSDEVQGDVVVKLKCSDESDDPGGFITLPDMSVNVVPLGLSGQLKVRGKYMRLLIPRGVSVLCDDDTRVESHDFDVYFTARHSLSVVFDLATIHAAGIQDSHIVVLNDSYDRWVHWSASRGMAGDSSFARFVTGVGARYVTYREGRTSGIGVSSNVLGSDWYNVHSESRGVSYRKMTSSFTGLVRAYLVGSSFEEIRAVTGTLKVGPLTSGDPVCVPPMKSVSVAVSPGSVVKVSNAYDEYALVDVGPSDEEGFLWEY